MILTSNLDEMIPITCNTEDRVLFGNVRAAVKLDLPWLGLTPAHDGTAVIVGGGPSMKGLLPMIAGHQKAGHKVFALNGVVPLLDAADVTPDFFVMLDARPENVAFVRPDRRTHYLIASQCDPGVFEALEGHDVTVWHPRYEGIEDHIGPGRYALIGGGCTVGLQAMCVAYAMGYRMIHLYGFDSSYSRGGEGHAYPQPANAADEREVFYIGHQEYVAAPWMARQAMEFQTLAGKLAEDDTIIHVHGTGLLPAVAKAMTAEPMAEDEKYRRMWEHDAYRNVSPGEGFAEAFVAHVKPRRDQLVIDFGCGTGRGGKRIHELVGCDVILTDLADNARDADVTLPFVVSDLTKGVSVSGDLGYCTDVMEHIPPGDVPAVIDNIMAAVPECFFKIALFHDNFGAVIGQTLHLSVFPVEWWSDRFAAYDIVHASEDRDTPLPYATFHIKRKAH